MGFWDFLFGKEPDRPGAPQMGAFQPYTQQYDPTAMKSLLEGYGKEQTKGIHERAAAKGTYYGAGGTVPGEIELAQTQSQALAQEQMQFEKMQQMQVGQQYLAYIEQKYGLESREYQNAFDEYLQRLEGRQEGISGLLGGGLGALGTIGGAWFGGSSGSGGGSGGGSSGGNLAGGYPYGWTP